MKTCLSIAALVSLAFCLGCGNYEPTMPTEVPPAAVPAGQTATPAPGGAATKPAQPAGQATNANPAGPAITAPANPAATPAAEPERVKAEVGVGKRGRDYGGGIITEPIRARFRIEDKLRFDQIQQAMNLYKAEHERYPKTHAEFMKNIVEANNIPLPELPPGEKYVYDPETAELMVERPAPPPANPK